MFKKFSVLLAILLIWSGTAFAQVDINKADQAALDGIKGIGPKMSQKILDERAKGGNFKDWNDVQSRVKGIKEKSAIRLSTAGLTVNGQAKDGAPAAVAANAAVSKVASANAGATSASAKAGSAPPSGKAPAATEKSPPAGKHTVHTAQKK